MNARLSIGKSGFSIIVSFVAMALLGCALIPLLPVKLVPSETLPAIGVAFSMRGTDSRTVESEVTGKLESALSRISGVKYVDSRSSTGRGYITLEFDRNTDLEIARFEAAMIVRQLWSNFPDNVSYPTIETRQVDANATRPFMSYIINADLLPARIMRYAEDNIQPRLSRIPGVAKVELSGANPMEWAVEYDSRLMAELGLSINEVNNALSSYYGSEFLKMAPLRSDDLNSWTRIAITGNGSSDTLDLSKIIIGRRAGQIITLDKIAQCSHVEQTPSRFFRINGLNSIYLNITATEDANQIEVSRKVKTVLDELDLPHGFMMNLSYDGSENISKELDTIYLRTGLTVLILLVFVALITLNWRYLLLITIGLAINMAIAFVAYYMLKVEIQLYSLAGITISLNLVIDNLIVMTEHVTRRHNLRAFSAVLAATLTTVGALSVVFFLDEKTMLSLKDFVIVVIVNLSISLMTALFLVPALVERMKITVGKKRGARVRRANLWIMRCYGKLVFFLSRRRRWVYAVFILAFGLPVFLLPDKVEGESFWAETYNKTLGSNNYRENIKPWVDRCLGGTLRLFAEKVRNGRYYGGGDREPVLIINATLPNGATLGQMNALVQKMEYFLTDQDGIRQFQTNIHGPNRGSIAVYFKSEHRRSGYPYKLMSDVVSKAQTLGGGSWSVYGLENNGFNNDVRENAGSYRIKLTGYNYDDLYYYACALRDTLEQHRRINDVVINSEFSYWKDDYTEFYLDIDKERLVRDSLSVQSIFNALSHELNRNTVAFNLPTSDGNQSIRLSSNGRDRDVWSFMNVPVKVGRHMVKLSDYASIERRQAPKDIVKYNQEYVLCLQYEYIGSGTQGNKLLDRTIEKFNKQLPIGYKAQSEDHRWYFGENGEEYVLLVLIALIIFFVSAILFNSLRQPLAIIFVIPVSFIGVFLTFYLFELKFDQGGFAAFILLCGITVNAAIYIINEYNSLRTRYPHISPYALYFKAFRAKITAVILTVLSTVLGFIPFLIGDTQEGFWFPLAAGTMGGLIFSMTAILFLLPEMVLPRVKKEESTKSISPSVSVSR